MQPHDLNRRYWLERLFVGGLGAFLLCAAISDVLWPDIIHDDGLPTPLARWTRILCLVAYGVLFLMPHRFTASGWAYQAKFAALVLGVVITLGLGIEGVIGWLGGHKHWAIVPVCLVFIALAIAGVDTLRMRKLSFET